MSLYKPTPVEIKKVTIENEVKDIKTFDVVFRNPEDAKEFKHLPGQFAELSVLGEGECTISITSSPTQEGYLQFCIKKIGVVTNAIHDLDVGAEFLIRGPYGNRFPVDIMKGRDLVFVAGGIGLAPLRSLINYVLAPQNRSLFNGVKIFYGSRNSGELLFKDDLEAWEKRDDVDLYVTIDRPEENWKGKVGFVNALLKSIPMDTSNTVGITCGPPIMIKFVLKDFASMGITPDRAVTTLENRMKCGVGKCGRCNVGKKYVCVDGPVFTYEELSQMPEDF